MDDLALLHIQFDTIFETAGPGRIVRTNDPDRSAGPLFWLGGSRGGNVFGVRADVTDDVAREVMAFAATEPPFLPPNDVPQHLEQYVRLLTRNGALPQYTPGVTYELQKKLPAPAGATTVDSESAERERLHSWLAANGMPDGLKDMGFHDASEFWPPWCAVLFYGQPVAVCFASRLAALGAEAGVATARNFRGRGFAAAAVAGWSRLKSLQSRALFYSTNRSNVSSQRVASRLSLRLIGNRMMLSEG
jgi:hypothetical protein